jgi:predicted neuraminidase
MTRNWAVICAFLLFTGALISDPALLPPRLIDSPGPEYSDANRRFQGIPCIERASNGRLWAVWYSGDIREGPRNYVVLATSGNDGKTWSSPQLILDPDEFVRAFDACLWRDPQDRLWLFWAQAAGHWDGRAGVWAIVTSDPGSARPAWSQPRRIADGVLMNKPIVRSNGEWLLPVALWTKPANLPFINERDRLNLSPDRLRELIHDPGDKKGANVIFSTDRGRTFQTGSAAPFPVEDGPTEHMLVERRDGSLWMLARTRYGIGESTSSDGGRTWSLAQPSNISHPSTRFFIRRLRSGRLLLVKHAPPNGKDRSHLIALLSNDDGRSWSGGLMLDDRMNVSYPDGVESSDGTIYVVYDRERFKDREILLAAFREDDIVAGKPVSGQTRLRTVVSRAGSWMTQGKPPMVRGSRWQALLNGRDVSEWHGRDDKVHEWYAAADVYIKPQRPRDLLEATATPGASLVNGRSGRTEDLISNERFGDFELYLEFLVTAKSNSGVYLHGLYEMQILDSYGAQNDPGVHDSGAVYERWINEKGVGGSAPARNMSLPPGEWQSFHIWFRAPRFNASGTKVEDARVLRLDYNGATVQKDVVLPGPTRASLDISEAPKNPLMLQGTHGPVAFRNIYIRPLRAPQDGR